jgi:hypothetical protein
MKKSELKNLLKPMIKECIKEVIFEEGVLSNIVLEVAQGLGRTTLVEAKQPVVDTSAEEAASRQKRQKAITEQKEQLLSAINKDAYGGVDVFEGTSPLSTGGKVSSSPETQGPLSGIEPDDPGVDISNIIGIAGNRWAAHMK